MDIMQTVYESPVGRLYLVASDAGLNGIYWSDKGYVERCDNAAAAEILALTRRQLDEYFAGARTAFTIPLALKGTPFQLRVWEKLQAISYGETKSYKQIATELNDPNACRAVGTANGKNPISIIIPCHRVVNTGGTLGGYAGGLETKANLLALEQQMFMPYALR